MKCLFNSARFTQGLHLSLDGWCGYLRTLTCLDLIIKNKLVTRPQAKLLLAIFPASNVERVYHNNSPIETKGREGEMCEGTHSPFCLKMNIWVKCDPHLLWFLDALCYSDTFNSRFLKVVERLAFSLAFSVCSCTVLEVMGSDKSFQLKSVHIAWQAQTDKG